jgi:broad specificity phosphatase PhoE
VCKSVGFDSSWRHPSSSELSSILPRAILGSARAMEWRSSASASPNSVCSGACKGDPSAGGGGPCAKHSLTSSTHLRDSARARDDERSAKEYDLLVRTGTPGTPPPGRRSMKDVFSPPSLLGLSSPGGIRPLRSRSEEIRAASVGAALLTSTVRREGKLVLPLVGLPARNKTFLCRALQRHLEWMGFHCRVFNLNQQGEEAEKSLSRALKSLEKEVDIAILDSTNTTREWRQWLHTSVMCSSAHAQVMFLEVILNDTNAVEANIEEMVSSCPHFRSEQAVEEFRARLQLLEQSYEPMTEEEGLSFVQVTNSGQKVVSCNAAGYLPGRILMLAANLHTKPRPIWMSRHGESEFNKEGKIGGNSALTEEGLMYADKLCDFMSARYPPGENLVVWTSTMKRTGQTVKPLRERGKWDVICWRNLDEIHAGAMDGLTYEHVAEHFPQEYEARAKDKLRYRYPHGESYTDVFARLETIILEMLHEETPLLIVGHQAILRVLYGYLTGKPADTCPTLTVPLHTLIRLVPKAHGCDEEWFTLGMVEDVRV